MVPVSNNPSNSRHNIDLYAPIGPDTVRRFVLGKDGIKPLFVIGLNPSEANREKSDPTITRVKEYSRRHQCDGFAMLNLYPQRTPYPDYLHTELDEVLHRENLAYITDLLGRYTAVNILAAWGGIIRKREFLKICLQEIFDATQHIKISWLQIGKELPGSGHPRHPGRGSYQDLYSFDVRAYMSRKIKV